MPRLRRPVGRRPRPRRDRARPEGEPRRTRCSARCSTARAPATSRRGSRTPLASATSAPSSTPRSAPRSAQTCTTSSTTRLTSPARSSSRPSRTRRSSPTDGFGDFASTMLAEGRGSSFRVLERVLFPHSLGIFYTAVTQWLGFPKYGDEGKVMGLAPYGTPRYLDEMRQLVRPKGDVFELGLDFFLHDKEGRGHDLGRGHAVDRPSLLRADWRSCSGRPASPAPSSPRKHEDVAASLQAMLEEAYLHLVRALWERTKIPRICLAGGVALNAVANGRIRPETPFEDVFVQPAAGDSGIAVGAALLRLEPGSSGNRAAFVMDHAYAGPDYSDADVRARALARPGSRRRAARRRRALPARGRADRRRRRRRLVPGPDGVRPPCARQPLDRRRPAPAGHEGRPEQPDQAPRALPPVRAVGPRRGDRRLVRAGLPLAVHGARLQDAGGEARGSSRRSTTSTTRAACRPSRGKRTRATTG